MRQVIKHSIPALVCGVGLGFASAAEAAEIHVPADFPTLQDAVAAAAAGDEVILAEGTYTIEETLEIPLNLFISGQGAQQTVLQCDTGDSTCIFTNYEFYVELRDLAIVAQGPGGGDVLSGYPLLLRKTVLVGTPERLCIYSNKGKLENNVIAGCGTGLYMSGGGDGGYVAHNVFLDNLNAIRLHFNGPSSANPYLYNNVFMGSATAVSSHVGSPSNEFTRPMEGNAFFANITDGAGFELNPELNVFGDPRFVELGAPPDYLSYDLHLLDDSPCIDSGRPLQTGPWEDVDGDPRPLGDAPDCGVDEHEVVDTGTETGADDDAGEGGDEGDGDGDTTTGEAPDTGADTQGEGSDTDEGGAVPSSNQGCGCRAAPRPLGGAAWAWLILALGITSRRWP